MSRFYNSRISRKPKKHCYIIVFSIDGNNQVGVLGMRKKVFSSKDGFVHNNPGQIVFPGGKSEQNEDYNNAALREFEEELYTKLDKKNIVDSYEDNYFHFTYYEVRDEDFDNFDSNLQKNIKNAENNRFNDKFVEINEYYWIELNEMKYVMNPNLIENPPDVLDNTLNAYISNVINNKDWKLNNEIKELEKYLNLIHNNNPIIYDIMNDLKRNNINSPYYQLFKSFLVYYFYKKSSIDWFNIGLNNFEKLIK